MPPAFAHTIAADTAATTEDRKMQKRIFILISATTLAITAAAQVGAIDPFGSRSGQALSRPGSEHDYEQQHEKKQKYTCPMHPEVITDHPGNCPKCGMTLVPKEEKKHSMLNTQGSTSNHQSHLPHQSH